MRIIVAATDDKVGNVFCFLASLPCSVCLFLVNDLVSGLYRVLLIKTTHLSNPV